MKTAINTQIQENKVKTIFSNSLVANTIYPDVSVSTPSSEDVGLC